LSANPDSWTDVVTPHAGTVLERIRFGEVVVIDGEIADVVARRTRHGV
jgi:hypothetical protein